MSLTSGSPIRTIKKNKDFVGSVDEPVILSTVQSAKGLEFKNVIVCGLGMKSDMTTARKLLYVGFTRAVDQLEVITANSSPFASDVVAASLAWYESREVVGIA